MSFPSFSIPHPDYVFAILVVLVLAIAIGVTAHRRGHSGFGYFLLSLVLTPVVTFFLLAVAGQRPQGEIIIPEPGPYERPLTSRQQQELSQFGVRDPSIIESIGRDQADSVIAQLRASGDRFSLVPLFFLMVFGAAAIYVVHSHFKLTVPWSSGKPSATAESQATPAAPAEPEPQAPPVDRGPAPVLSSWAGPLVITTPVVVQARYGKVTIPAGTQVKLVSAGNGVLRIQYGGDLATIPAAATNYPR